MMKFSKQFKTTQTKLILVISVFFTIFYNFSFYKRVLAVFSLQHQFFFLLSLTFAVTCATNLVLTLLRVRKILKPFLIFIFVLASLAAYVMDSYGVVIDEGMIVNIMKTDAHEAFDLVSPMLFVYFLFLGLLPSFLIYKLEIEQSSFKSELLSRAKTLAASVVLIFCMLVPFGKNYATFFREQKSLRYYANPTYFIYSIGKYASSVFTKSSTEMTKIGLDAKLSNKNKNKELVIFVVGETARGDRFSLNGYKKETNPMLKKENIISFTNMTSCGTSTAVSVPCIFSNLGRNGFSNTKAATTENLLDILNRTKGISVLWRDNNSNSKGVADRVAYEDFKSPQTNSICDPECRDEGMLKGLQEYINKNQNNKIFIILHQMGNHGPAYSKRYPKAFERFKPVCETNELEKCSNDEISNAYDNAILYTDYFLSKVIELLKANSSEFKTTMIYASDHGESLGENGVYLHGLPYFMAPYEQKHIGVVMWFGGAMEKEIKFDLLRLKAQNPYSHDNIFHTILGLFEVETSIYDQKLDILDGLRHR